MKNQIGGSAIQSATSRPGQLSTGSAAQELAASRGPQPMWSQVSQTISPVRPTARIARTKAGLR
jgi:hypothetical protein